MTVYTELRREGAGVRGRPKRYGIVFLLALSATMTLSSFFGAQASVFERARETVLDIAEPVVSIFGAPSRWLSSRIGNIEDYFRIYAENKRLREENAELRVWMEESRTLRRQLAYYESLLDTKLPTPATFVDASVIGESQGPFDRSLILSAGRNDGVKLGLAVVDDGGMVGHVVSAGRSAARVLLLTDQQSRLPVFIEEVEVQAILAGRSAGDPVLDVFADADIERVPPGSRVVTSGADGMLPRGLPVGVVTAGRDGKGRPRVELFGNFTTPDLVRVVDYAFPSDVELEEILSGRPPEADDG
ncbi:rod shape-determining protein MreC [Parvularcula bermudensis HTCC2503]|uniref:Cell shape-determining protein MreC n=1 Tax=Parvularcula bermudensis (strain ATCC BAA-594 / HTCC2503 / KCTC 12087) TaxID=314260 RepID=E0TB80_PARBH|nr:rod shape-determining protein MreC [Parvularcula bermudensis]ADM08284.1 rod shape-determining protein MreC [Parvularcula bermudensis HTCC2503]